MSNKNSLQDVPPGSPDPPPPPAVRFYLQQGEPRVEISDGYAAIDLGWRDYERLVNDAGIHFSHWATRNPQLYQSFLDEGRQAPFLEEAGVGDEGPE